MIHFWFLIKADAIFGCSVQLIISHTTPLGYAVEIWYPWKVHFYYLYNEQTSVCSVVLKREGSLPSFSHQTWSETVCEDSVRVTWTVIVSVIDPQRKAAVQIRLWKRPRHRLCPEHPGQRWAVARGVSWSERELRQVGSRPGPHRVRHSPGDAENPQPGQPRVFRWPHPSAGLTAWKKPPDWQWFQGLYGLHLSERAGTPFK